MNIIETLEGLRDKELETVADEIEAVAERMAEHEVDDAILERKERECAACEAYREQNVNMYCEDHREGGE